MTEKKKSTASPRKRETDLFLESEKPAAKKGATSTAQKSNTTVKTASAKNKAASSGSAARKTTAAGKTTSTASKTSATRNSALSASKAGKSASTTRKTSTADKTDSTARKSSATGKFASALRKSTTAGKSVSTARKAAPSGRTAPSTVASNPVADAAVRRSERVSAPARAMHRRAVLAVDNRGEDDYDRFLRSQETPRKAPKPHKKRKRGHFAVTFLLLLMIGGLALVAYRQNDRYIAFAEMKNAVNRQTFYAGTTVEGVDVSNMTLDQAIEYWKTNIEPGYENRTVTLSNGQTYTAQSFGYSSDYQTVLANAYSAGRSGSLVERYQALSTRVDQPANYEVTRRLYDAQLIADCASALASGIDTAAQDAKIQSFDLNSYAFTFSDSVAGKKLDAESLKADIARALENGGGAVTLNVQTIEPSVRKEDIASEYGMIAYAVTNASSSSSNRLSNIRLALQLINGTRLAPGETFSFNDTVGKRTTERGFKLATAYSSGEITEDVGGGICQVSTTLFNAVVKADMQIDERHNHSLTVAYVDKGKDAAVNWKSQDLKFTNTSEDDVYLVCVLTDDKRVRIGVFGKLLPNGETIEIEAQTTGTIDYDTVYQPSLSLAPGTTNVTQKGKNGYTAVAYKVRKDANGNTISRELLCKSSYKATNQVIEYGP